MKNRGQKKAKERLLRRSQKHEKPTKIRQKKPKQGVQRRATKNDEKLTKKRRKKGKQKKVINTNKK